MTYTDPSGFLSLGGLWDVFNPSIFVNVNLSRSTRNRMQTAPPPIGCFVAASGCYGGSAPRSVFDVITDAITGPVPTYGLYDELVIYNRDPNDFEPWESEIMLAKTIGFGILREFILDPAKDIAEGKLMSAGCKIAKLCRVVERYAGKVVGEAYDRSVEYLKRKFDKVPKRVEVPRSRYPEGTAHIEDAQAAGHPSVLTVDRAGTEANRAAAQAGHARTAGMDLDEYPPAMFREGGSGASVRPMTPAQNRGMGSCIGNQCRGVPDGSQVEIIVVD